MMMRILVRCFLLGGSFLSTLEAFQVSPRATALRAGPVQTLGETIAGGGGVSSSSFCHDSYHHHYHHHATRMQQVSLARKSSSTQLSMFLPPGGGGSNNKSELGQIATAVLTFAAVTLFFISPLGGLFFALFNSLLALSILIPVGAFVAFQVWSYLNTVTGVCPNCTAQVKATKDGSPSLCFNCGAIVQAKDGEIYLANPNQRDIFAEDAEPSVMNWFDGINGGARAPSAPDVKKKTTRTTINTTIIDVDVTRDDD